MSVAQHKRGETKLFFDDEKKKKKDDFDDLCVENNDHHPLPDDFGGSTTRTRRKRRMTFLRADFDFLWRCTRVVSMTMTTFFIYLLNSLLLFFVSPFARKERCFDLRNTRRVLET